MKAVFFDRDGTLIKDQHYLARPDQVELLPGAADALQEARRLGFEIFIISNQSGVARGFFDESAVQAANQRMVELLGLTPKAIYCCFHLPGGLRPEYAIECDCRKPKPGMLQRAQREHGIQLDQSYVIGDSMRDLQAGRAAGASTVMVLTGEGVEYVRKFGRPIEADHVADSLAEAMRWIGGR